MTSIITKREPISADRDLSRRFHVVINPDLQNNPGRHSGADRKTRSKAEVSRNVHPDNDQSHTQWDNTKNPALSATRGFTKSWIPARAGMIALLRAILFILPCTPLYAAPPTENEVKAAFIHNIAKFVEWPTETATQGNLKLCILGQPPFTEASYLLNNKPIGSTVWEVQSIDHRADLRECRVLFIAASESGNLRHLLDAIKDSAVLTVGDSNGYAAQGVMINFYPEHNKVRFEINANAALRAKFKINPQLLKLARIVHESGRPQ